MRPLSKLVSLIVIAAFSLAITSCGGSKFCGDGTKWDAGKKKCMPTT